MSEKEIQGFPAPPDTKSWLEYSWKLQQDVPNRFEDAAKFLATIISLTITIIFTALDKLEFIVPHRAVLVCALTIWLAALFFAVMTLFPHKYAFHSKSVENIKEAQQQIIETKKTYFLIALGLYFLPLSVLAILYLISIF
jgi:hypothetical protein